MKELELLAKIRDDYSASIVIKLQKNFVNCTLLCEKREIKIKEYGNDFSVLKKVVEKFYKQINEQEAIA